MANMKAILWNYSFLIAQVEALQEIADGAGNIDAAGTLKAAADEMQARYATLQNQLQETKPKRIVPKITERQRVNGYDLYSYRCSVCNHVTTKTSRYCDNCGSCFGK